MKKLGIGVLVLLGVVALALTVALQATRVLPVTAEQFFELIAAGETADAYATTAQEFRYHTDESAFAQFVTATGLARYKGVSWHYRAIERDRGSLEGTLRIGDGSRPVTVDLVRENSEWRILALELGDVGVRQAADAPGLPADEELRQLTNNAVRLLAEAIEAGDFADFHRQIAQLWQRQVTEEQLRQAFDVFMERGIDIAYALEAEPQFSQSPVIENDGVLVLRGYYPAEPQPLYFSLEHVYEHPEWKLLGIDVRL